LEQIRRLLPQSLDRDAQIDQVHQVG
jgi:hypothetical protein